MYDSRPFPAGAGASRIAARGRRSTRSWPSRPSSAGRTNSSKVTSAETGLPGRPKTRVGPIRPNARGLPGLTATFQKPKNASADFYADMAEQMREATVVAPWNYRLGRGLSPSLVEDKGFDLEYHFRRSALAQPGGER